MPDETARAASSGNGADSAAGTRPLLDTAETQRLSRTFIGRKLGSYQVVREIGHGSMGIVFEAIQDGLARKVALKILPPSLSVTETVIRRFLREAQSVAQLSHENIVQIHEIGDQDGVFYYAMQFVEGHALDRVLRERAFTPRECATLCAHAARALFFAHEHGIMHRDVKPGNIIITYKDKPVLTDFGLARPEKAATLTESGALVGTPMYMSPEQVRGDRAGIDRRTDIYSLGVTLYEMLAGVPPFEATSTQEILRKIEFEEPRPLRRLNPSVPKELATICHKAMEKEPERRYQTAIEFALDLERFLGGETIQARPTSLRTRLWRQAKRHKVISMMSVALLLAAGGWLASILATRDVRELAEQNELRASAAELANAMKAGGEFFAGRRWSDAIAQYDRAVGLQHDYVPAYVERGRCYFLLENYQAALAEFDAALAVEPGLSSAELWRGITKCRAEQWDEGLALISATLRDVRDDDLNDMICLRETSRLCLAFAVDAERLADPTRREQFLAAAHRWIGKVLENNPADDEALVIQGKLYEFAGVLHRDENLVELAIDNYARAYEVNFRNVEALQLARRDVGDVLAPPQPVAQEPAAGAPKLGASGLFPVLSLFNGELAVAGMGLDAVASRLPLPDRGALLSRALDAVGWADASGGARPASDPDRTVRVNDLLRRASEKWIEGDSIGAGLLYMQVLEIEPGVVDAHQRLAEHYLNHVRNPAAARIHVERARAIAPSNPRTLFLAYHVYRALDDEAAVKEVVDTVVHFHPQLKVLLDRRE